MEESEPFKPYVAPSAKMKEMTPRAIILGILLSIFFALGNAYLGLKVGMTVSASIPAAILSMGILRIFFKNVTILENNIVQTTAAVGEGLAAGVIFTIPALYFLHAIPSNTEVFILSFLGGILGILFMIPMRRYIIVKEHKVLPFPEGTACSSILKSGESSQNTAIYALWGIVVGVVFKFLSGGLHLWREVVRYTFKSFENTQLSMDCTPALLGVGFIIGPRISAIMLSGGILGWWVFIPLIKMFGQGQVSIFPSADLIVSMSAMEVWSSYIRYIGAGAVAAGGLFNLFRLVPVLKKTIAHSFSELFEKSPSQIRTEKDIPLAFLILGSIVIILFLWFYPSIPLNFLTILILVVLGFFFVAVTSITVGLVGSSSNPVSGMVITTLLITCLIFVALGWTERFYLISAITMSCVANIAICLASTTSQDLKTGFLLGATPRSQQIAEIIGLVIPTLMMGTVLYLLNKAYGFGSPELPAPQATLMALIAKGVMSGDLPITLVGIGVVLGIVVKLMHLPILPFAIGLYLPLSLSTPVALGGFVHFLIKRFSKRKDSIEQGILVASGLVAGDACMGVIIALLAVTGVIQVGGAPLLGDIYSLIAFLIITIFLSLLTLHTKKKKVN